MESGCCITPPDEGVPGRALPLVEIAEGGLRSHPWAA